MALSIAANALAIIHMALVVTDRCLKGRETIEQAELTQVRVHLVYPNSAVSTLQDMARDYNTMSTLIVENMTKILKSSAHELEALW